VHLVAGYRQAMACVASAFRTRSLWGDAFLEAMSNVPVYRGPEWLATIRAWPLLADTVNTGTGRRVEPSGRNHWPAYAFGAS
jgi:hypothetical protein